MEFINFLEEYLQILRDMYGRNLVDGFLIGFVLFIVVLFMRAASGAGERKRTRLKLKSIATTATTLTYQEFEQVRTHKEEGGKYLSNQNKIEGVYVLRNKDNKMTYVGQGVHIMSRVSQHFSGRGNGDVYADFRSGDDFEISLIPLKGSGYYSLNELERKFIDYYNSRDWGYNRTRGTG